MSSSITTLSSTRLKSLLGGPTVSIHYKATDESEYQVLHSAFPRGVATTFSKKWADLFSPVNKLTVGAVQQGTPQTLNLVGGDPTAHIENLKWMVSCCKGKGLQALPRINEKPFSRYFFLRESASLIGCDYLEKLFQDRMSLVARRQIHSEDVRVLYKRLPADHEILGFLAEHVATLTWNNELKAKRAYYTLREEFPELDTAINAILDPLIQERFEKRKAERGEHYQRSRQDVRGRRQNKSAAAGKDEAKQVNSAVQQKAEDAAKEVEKANTEKPQPVTTRIVPGAEIASSISQIKNKAAKRRQRKREAKATQTLDE